MKTFNIFAQSRGGGGHYQESLFFQNHPIYRFSSGGFLSIFILDITISSSSNDGDSFINIMTVQNIPEEDLSSFYISKGCVLTYTYVETTIYVVGCLLKARNEMMSGTANSTSVRN